MAEGKIETMPSEYFDFKRFRVYHDRCAMKVGTDGVLLGAWCDVEGAHDILDIGTGSGLVALMVAQRQPAATVTAVENDGAAARQAAENARRSPFADRINVVHADIRAFDGEQLFDRVVSNPPFFEETLLPPDPARSAARHAGEGGLTFGELARCAARLLREDGRFAVVVPTGAAGRIASECEAVGLRPVRRTEVVTRPGKQPKRVLLEFARLEAEEEATSSLTLSDATGGRSPEYRRLAEDFYL